MIRDGRLIACVVLSVAAHIAFAHEMRRLPAHATDTTKRVVTIRVVSPPPAPLPPETPPPEAPKPQPVAHEHVRAHPTPTRAPQPVAESPPPPDIPRPTADPTATPVFGVDMESTSPGGSGPALPIGNSGRGAPGQQSGGGNGSNRHAAPEPMAPVEAYEVTKMPLPQGDCQPKFTDEARQAGTEGTVVLEVTIDEKGRARDIKVVSGLPHGLTEAAIAALKACRFNPGERDGKPVPVRLGATKFRFFETEAE